MEDIERQLEGFRLQDDIKSNWVQVRLKFIPTHYLFNPNSGLGEKV
jgi:hypothetical protein